VRQRNLKVLAAEADARWAAKPSFLNAPQKEDDNLQPTKHLMDQGDRTQSTESSNTKSIWNAIEVQPEDLPQRTELGNNPGGEANVGNLKSKNSDITRQELGKHEQPKPAEDPWKQARGGPSEGWQPRAWDGNLATPKR
jgi:NADH dehydrogenase [ubiquinone] 1 alpha subcomplex assembly factor 2